jgi:hypothetical protein
MEQCGLGPLSHQPTPTLVSLPSINRVRGSEKDGVVRVVEVACGRRHTVVLGECADSSSSLSLSSLHVFVTGDNSQGQVCVCVYVYVYV